MRTHPRVLRVEAGSLSLQDMEDSSLTHLMDVHPNVPRLWRAVEERFRLDASLAIQAKRFEDRCDIIWADSEKVGIPLSFMRLNKPLVVVAHHMSSPMKARFARVTGAVNRWAGIGYISDESRKFFIDYFGVHPDAFFQYESSKYLDKASSLESSYFGPLMSVGVAKRDYRTLVSALAGLPGCEAEIFVSSKFGDCLDTQVEGHLPKWVNLRGWVAEDELLSRYQHTRFVVVPLQATTHHGAGINVVLEAGAFSKAVIGTRTGGMATFVKDGETGILVPPYDVKALRNAIQRLWDQPELAQQMGRAARHYVEARFNPREVNSRIISFLDKLYMNHQHSR